MKCKVIVAVIAFMVAAALMARWDSAHASSPTMDECLEAGDFIFHAAQARDGGMAKTIFLDKLRADYRLIKQYPPSLRWFVHDQQDEDFLLDQTRDVFDHPTNPEMHRSKFLRACTNHIALATSDD